MTCAVGIDIATGSKSREGQMSIRQIAKRFAVLAMLCNQLLSHFKAAGVCGLRRRNVPTRTRRVAYSVQRYR